MSQHTSIDSIRHDYQRDSLGRSDLNPSPHEQFAVWLQDAIDSGLPEPTAMTLATVGADGGPTARTVLLKDQSQGGFTFYTNYESRKGQEMATQPQVGLLFLWKELERQVHIRGVVEKVSQEESESYFFSRPYASRIGAWASRQSQEIESREALLAQAAEAEARFPDTGADDCVPLPEFWGGYRVKPTSFEFWQGGPGRKHDRFIYRPEEGGDWEIIRLNP